MITTEFIFMSAIIVFLLMVVGLVLSMREFERISEEPSQRKDTEADRAALQHPSRHADGSQKV